MSRSDKFKLIRLIKHLHDKNKLYCKIIRFVGNPLGVPLSIEEFIIGLRGIFCSYKKNGELYYGETYLQLIKAIEANNRTSEVRFSVENKFDKDSKLHDVEFLKKSNSSLINGNFVDEITEFIKNNDFVIKSNNYASITDYIKNIYKILNGEKDGNFISIG